MNIQRILRLAALGGGLLSLLSGVAPAAILPSVITLDEQEMVAPAPRSIVTPVGVPRRYLNEVVRLSLTVDETGRPRHVRLLACKDAALARALLPAVARWQFSPALKHGRPVSVEVILPVELVEGN